MSHCQTADKCDVEQRNPRTPTLTKENLDLLPDSVLHWMVSRAKGNDLATLGGVLADRYFGSPCVPAGAGQRENLVRSAQEATSLNEFRCIGSAWRKRLLDQH